MQTVSDGLFLLLKSYNFLDTFFFKKKKSPLCKSELLCLDLASHLFNTWLTGRPVGTGLPGVECSNTVHGAPGSTYPK